MFRNRPPRRVLVLADDSLARAGLASILAEDARLAVVGQAELGPDAVAAAEYGQPEIAIVDLGWSPSRSVSRLSALELDLPLVLLLPPDEPAAAIRSLAPRGLLGRGASGERLRAAVRAAAEGWLVSDPAFAPPPGRPALHEADGLDLTPRELEVLALVAEGLPNKAIARRLEISEHTVKFHVDAILSKLNAQSRTEAAVRAALMGLVPL